MIQRIACPKRLAAAMALLAFAGCLISGMRAENTFDTTVVRALEAMIVTLVDRISGRSDGAGHAG